MIECMIIGDSIAVGVANYRHECEVHAKVGITSHNWNVTNKNVNIEAETVIISLGTNDRLMNTEKELLAIRDRTKATKIVWIIPAKNNKEIVQGVAFESHDKYITIDKTANDGTHPTMAEYKRIAENTK